MSALLRVCALAHPRTDRAYVLALADELVEDGAPKLREAASLLSSGLAARLRLHGAPWREALAQLALPVASLLLAALILGGTRAPGWIGWSWTGGIAGAVAALAGIALGRRALALPGALLVAGLCVIDGLRDQYGIGSRWMALFVDVLPALAPLAIVLVAAAVHPRAPHAWRRATSPDTAGGGPFRPGTAIAARHPADPGSTAAARRPAGPGSTAAARRLAWSGAATAALVVFALALDFHTTAGTTVLVAAAALCLTFTLRALRRSATAVDQLAGAIALAAATPAVAWCLVSAGPLYAAPDPLVLALLVTLVATGVRAALALATQRR